MASTFRCLLVLTLQLQLALHLGVSADHDLKDGTSARAARHEHGSALFVFGDSYADTGNHNPHDNDSSLTTPWRPPYGKTWPGHPSGRFSDGRVFTDFFASFLGVRQPIPYRQFNHTNRGARRHAAGGINFAFGGSGVFPTFGAEYPNVSAQIDQLTGLVQKGLVSKKLIEESTVLLVVAGNDYTAYEEQHPNATELALEEFIGEVVGEIGLLLQALQEKVGFQKIVANKLQPVGCLPSSTSALNYSSCNLQFNQLASLHNSLLAARVATLQAAHPAASFSTLDFYSAFETVISDAGFPLRPCCLGTGNGTSCGDVSEDGQLLYTLCSSPQKSLFWDLEHPTNAGWTAITKTLFASITK